VYTYSADGVLHCFHKIGGATNWNRSVTGGRPTWGFASSPLIEGTQVWVNAGSRGKAVDKTHPGAHNIIVAGDDNAAGYASPFAFTRGTQRTVVVFGGQNCSGINPANGAVLWYFSWAQGMADPIIYNDKVWVSCGYNVGCAVANLGSNALTKVWSNGNIKNKENCSVLYNGFVYGVTEDGALRCVDFTTGNLKWSQSGFPTESSIMIASNELVVLTGQDNGSGDGNLVVVAAATNGYSEIRRQNAILSGDTWTCPVLANGRLYLRNHQGTLIAFLVNPDVDADGLPDAWETAHGLSPTNAGDAAVDCDSDGAFNREEYVAGTDPTNAQNCLKLRINPFTNGVVVSFSSVRAVGAGYEGLSRAYTLENSADLLVSNWQAVAGCSNVAGNDAAVNHTNNFPSSGFSFYRVRTRLQ